MKNLLPDVRQAMRAAVLGVATATTALPIMDAFFNTQTSTANAQDAIPHTQNNHVFVEAMRQTLLDMHPVMAARLYTALQLNATSSDVNPYADSRRILRQSLTLWDNLNSVGFRQLGLDDKVPAIQCLLAHMVTAAKYNFELNPDNANAFILDDIKKSQIGFYNQLNRPESKSCRDVYRRLGL
jgi:hypothetical protein